MAQLSAARVSAVLSFYEVCQCKKTFTAGSQAPTAGPHVSTAAGPQASTAGPQVPTAAGPQASTAAPQTITIRHPGPHPEQQLAYKRLKDTLHRWNTLKSRSREIISEYFSEIISESDIAMADLNAAIDGYSQFDSRLKSLAEGPRVPATGPKTVA